jgi:hypothetical protein
LRKPPPTEWRQGDSMLKASVKYGLAKLYVCLSGCLTLYQLAMVPEGYGAQFLMAMLAITVFLGLIDAIVNDLMPYQYFAFKVKEYRYVIFVSMGGTQLSLIYSDVVAHAVDFDTIRYATDASVAVMVAVLGLWSRHRWAAKNHDSDLVESPAP